MVVGEVVVLRFYTYNSSGVLADATTVTCTITRPDGTTTNPTVTKTATGTYEATFTGAIVGTHGVYWLATGTNATAKEDSFTVEDQAVAPPVSLSEVKDYLNMTDTDINRDAELLSFLNAAVSAIEQRVGPLTRRTVTEVHNGGVSAILLRQPPVLSVTSVTESGSTVTGYSLSASAGVLTRVSGYSRSVWTDGFGNISVTYVAGRTLVPADLRQAVLEATKHLWETQRGKMRRGQDDFIAGSAYLWTYRINQLIAPYELPGLA